MARVSFGPFPQRVALTALQEMVEGVVRGDGIPDGTRVPDLRDPHDQQRLLGRRDAAGYDESSAFMFAPEVLDPAVDFLAGLAGDGPPSSSRSGPGAWRSR